MTDTRGPLHVPGSDANPILVGEDTAKSTMDYDHVHDLEDNCLKRRAGKLCSGPADLEEASKDAELEAWLEHFARDVAPRMAASAMAMVVLNGWTVDGFDAKSALEMGTLMLMDKPLIVVAGEDQPLPAAVERAAAAIVRGELGSPEMGERLQAAIVSLQDRLGADRVVDPSGF